MFHSKSTVHIYVMLGLSDLSTHLFICTGALFYDGRPVPERITVVEKVRGADKDAGEGERTTHFNYHVYQQSCILSIAPNLFCDESLPTS